MIRIISKMGPELQPVYVRQGNDKEQYRQIIAGVGWPAGDLPGALVVLGEDVTPDRMTQVRPLWVLAESRALGGEPFFLPETMFKAMIGLTSRLMVSRWFGLPCPYPRERSVFNRDMLAKRLPSVHVQTPMCSLEMSYLGTLVRRRMVANSGLFFGRDNGVQASLRSLPTDMSTVNLPDLPDVAAVTMALAGLERAVSNAVGVPSRMQGRPADSVAGY